MSLQFRHPVLQGLNAKLAMLPLNIASGIAKHYNKKREHQLPPLEEVESLLDDVLNPNQPGEKIEEQPKQEIEKDLNSQDQLLSELFSAVQSQPILPRAIEQQSSRVVEPVQIVQNQVVSLNLSESSAEVRKNQLNPIVVDSQDSRLPRKRIKRDSRAVPRRKNALMGNIRTQQLIPQTNQINPNFISYENLPIDSDLNRNVSPKDNRIKPRRKDPVQLKRPISQSRKPQKNKK